MGSRRGVAPLSLRRVIPPMRLPVLDELRTLDELDPETTGILVPSGG